VTADPHKRHGFIREHFYDGNINYPIETVASDVNLVHRFIDGYEAIIAPERMQPN
jgi:hypothetical protein